MSGSTPSARRAPASLSRVLGLGFSIALAFGNTVGVGILRLPGTVAAALGAPSAVIAVWIIGGIYALLGALSVGELAALRPSAGGFYVYARSAFGPRAGFAVAWNDWILNAITLAYAALTARDFIVALAPSAAAFGPWSAAALLVGFTVLQGFGVRIGGLVQNLISAGVGGLLVLLAIACVFVSPPTHAAQAAPHLGAMAAIAGIGLALRTVIVTYDGWYGAIYLAEETVDARTSVPRAMIGCALLVTALYVLINIGFLHALGIDGLARSRLPAADVAGRIAPAGGAAFVTILSLMTVLGLINAILLSAPRIAFGAARDGYLAAGAAQVGRGGTPQIALALTGGAATLLVLAGPLERLVAVAAVIFILNYVSAYVSLFRLRRTEPGAERPFRTPGYPVTTLVVLAGSLVFLGLTLLDDPVSGLFAAGLMACAVPAYALARRGAKARMTSGGDADPGGA